MSRYFPIEELKRAHRELTSAFIQPGHTLPANFEAAMDDELWRRLLKARASINRYHARLRAKHSGLYIHHGARHDI